MTKRPLSVIDTVVIHCAASPDGDDRFTIHDIDRWHKERGWACVGYHYVIHINGAICQGRAIDEVGAHCPADNLNHTSLGVCLIGTQKFTTEQWVSLRAIVRGYDLLLDRELRKIGHRDAMPDRLCPGFSVESWVSGGMEPLAGHVLA